MCHVSGVTYHGLCVTCHLSLTPTAKATDPPPANSPIMHSGLICKDQKPKKMSKRKKNDDKKNQQKIFRGRSISVI